MEMYGNGNLRVGDLVWLIEDCNKRWYYKLSDGMIQLAIVRTDDGVFKRPVLKLAPVLPNGNLLVIENRAGYVEATLHVNKSNQNQTEHWSENRATNEI